MSKTYLLLIIFALTSSNLLSYIYRVKVLENKNGSKIVLFGDRHMSIPETDKAQKQIVTKNLKLLAGQKQISKVWIEGSSKEVFEFIKSELKPNQFLDILEVENVKECLNLINIENRYYLNDIYLLSLKMDKVDLKALAKSYKEKLALAKRYPNIYKKKYNEPVNLKKLAFHINHIKSVESYSTPLSMVKKMMLDIKSVLKELEIKFQKIISEKKISNKLEIRLSKEFDKLKEFLKETYDFLEKSIYQKNDFETICNVLSSSTASFLDLNFILEFLRDPEVKKHIFFTGGAHVKNIAKILKSDDYRVTYRNILINLQSIRPLALDEKDFDLILH